MTRVTKKELQRRLDEAISFQKATAEYMPVESFMERRETPGFVSVEQYPPWCVAHAWERGYVNNTRIFVQEWLCSVS